MPLYSVCLESHNYDHSLSGCSSSPDTSIPRPMSIFLTDGSGGITHYTDTRAISLYRFIFPSGIVLEYPISYKIKKLTITRANLQFFSGNLFHKCPVIFPALFNYSPYVSLHPLIRDTMPLGKYRIDVFRYFKTTSVILFGNLDCLWQKIISLVSGCNIKFSNELNFCVHKAPPLSCYNSLS